MTRTTSDGSPDCRTTIGLEVHVQLKTKSKMFCGCATGFVAGLDAGGI